MTVTTLHPAWTSRLSVRIGPVNLAWFRIADAPAKPGSTDRPSTAGDPIISIRLSETGGMSHPSDGPMAERRRVPDAREGTRSPFGRPGLNRLIEKGQEALAIHLPAWSACGGAAGVFLRSAPGLWGREEDPDSLLRRVLTTLR